MHAAVLTAAGTLGLSGCVSPYAGCVIPAGGNEFRAPPAAWAQRHVPISPSPVQYDRRAGMAPPVLELQSAPAIDLEFPGTVPSAAGPAISEWTPTLHGEQSPMIPSATSAPSCPPPAPAAETPPETAVERETTVPAATQSMIDELSARITNMDRRLQEQSQALVTAQHEATTAQEMTQKLEAEFNVWRAELSQVQEAIRAQSSADLEVLDELNITLEQLLPQATAPQPPPPTSDESHLANKRRPSGVRR